MIVYNLKCRNAHHFEAWFRDSAAYQDHAGTGRVACPVCGSKKVEKAPMAPRLAKGAQVPKPTRDGERMSKAMRDLRRRIGESCDYVGGEFAEEARKIHYGETDPRGIYGEASDQEAETLQKEGISFCRIPWPARRDS